MRRLNCDSLHRWRPETRRRRFRWLGVLTAMILTGEAAAGVIQNGEFTDNDAASVGTPFPGWQSLSPVLAPMIGGTGANPLALFSVGDPGGAQEARQLFQSFMLPSDAVALSFDVWMSTTPNGNPQGLNVNGPFDSFFASLYGGAAGTEPLFEIVSNLDAFFAADTSVAPTEPIKEFSSGAVSVSSLPSGYRQVRLDLRSTLESFGSLQSGPLTLSFALLGADDGFDTTVQLDRVRIDQSVIPEPSSIAIWSLCGLAGVAVAVRRRKRTDRP